MTSLTGMTVLTGFAGAVYLTSSIVQLDTLRFCRRVLTSDPREAGGKFYDPKGRQYDQMTEAARSGRQNIIEGQASEETACRGTRPA